MEEQERLAVDHEWVGDKSDPWEQAKRAGGPLLGA